MIKALWVSGIVMLLAVTALFKAPAGQADPFGTLLRTALATGVIIFLGQLVGTAAHRRPPHVIATRVVILIFIIVPVEVLAIGFSPNWSVALAVWYLALAAAGVLMNRWCDAPERYTIMVATFIVVASSVILMVIAALTPRAPSDLTSNAVLVSLWPNVTRIAGHPVEAAWTWLAWRAVDRLRPPERRPKPVARVAVKPAIKKSA